MLLACDCSLAYGPYRWLNVGIKIGAPSVILRAPSPFARFPYCASASLRNW
nr:MAG TPA: hypothetical protein [Caudoviricetes sp.]